MKIFKRFAAPRISAASPSFAESPGLSSPGMNAVVAATITVAFQAFCFGEVSPMDEWKPRALARGASLYAFRSTLCYHPAGIDTYRCDTVLLTGKEK